MLIQSYKNVPKRVCALAIAAILGTAAASAHAETGSAAARDLSVNIDLLGIAQLNVDAQVPVSIQGAVNASVDENSLPSFLEGGSLLSLSTSTLQAQAEYAPGAISAAGAEVTVEDLNLSAVSLLGADLISVTAAAVHSRSVVMGYCLPSPAKSKGMFDDITFFNGFDTGNLQTGGVDGSPDPTDVQLTDPHISILGIQVPDLPLNPPPNTTVDLNPLGILGATLILNEQTTGGNGIDMASLTSNALHLTLNVIGLITADVVVAHSEGKLDCTQ